MKPWRAMDPHIEETIRVNDSETMYKMRAPETVQITVTLKFEIQL